MFGWKMLPAQCACVVRIARSRYYGSYPNNAEGSGTWTDTCTGTWTDMCIDMWRRAPTQLSTYICGILLLEKD